MNIAICGLGYVGAVTAACLARAGHTVVGVDVNEDKVRMIRDGVPPVIEEGLVPLMQHAVTSGALTATTDLGMALAGADASILCVGTPSRSNGSLDTTALERVCEEIGRALRSSARGQTIIIRSTVLPGTCRTLLIPRIEERAGRACDATLGVVYNPEFMREGSSVKDFYTPPFTIVGRDDEIHGSVVTSLYASIPAPVERTTIETSEMLKHACNAFHALKVTFANEIGVFAAAHQVDGREVMRMLCMDRKLNLSSSYLSPGFAFGGSCLPKDLRAVLHRARQAELNLPVLDSILPSNRAQLERGLEMIRKCGKTEIGLLGLTFKNGTDDLRESPYVELAERLLGKGYKLSVHDDHVSPAALMGSNKTFIQEHLPHIADLLAPLEAVMASSQVLVVCTNNPRYVHALRERRPGQIVIDLAGLPPMESSQSRRIKGIAW